jgi:sec-independent protein translocase protein TatB
MELLIILVAGLLILGPKRLPEAARQVGKAMAELRRVSAGFQNEMRDAFEPGEAAVSMDPEPARPVEVPPQPALPGPATPADAELHVPEDDPSPTAPPEETEYEPPAVDHGQPRGIQDDDPSRS